MSYNNNLNISQLVRPKKDLNRIIKKTLATLGIISSSALIYKIYHTISKINFDIKDNNIIIINKELEEQILNSIQFEYIDNNDFKGIKLDEDDFDFKECNGVPMVIVENQQKPIHDLEIKDLIHTGETNYADNDGNQYKIIDGNLYIVADGNMYKINVKHVYHYKDSNEFTKQCKLNE